MVTNKFRYNTIMFQLVDFINNGSVITFMLLFARLSGVLAFFPFFKSINIPLSVRTSLIIYLTIVFYPNVTTIGFEVSVAWLGIAILSEFLLGFLSAIILEVAFAAIALAGMQISNVMGFSMASVIDPQSGVNTPMLSSFFVLLGTLILLAFDGHHLMLIYINETMQHVALGTYTLNAAMWTYISKTISTMFMLGFILSFPVIALSLLGDIIFGMLMKTMPQFNLLVVGFPIKIGLAFSVIITTLGSMYFIFKKEFLVNMKYLLNLF
jgi:flagellar biosynthetic protein FliR